MKKEITKVNIREEITRIDLAIKEMKNGLSKGDFLYSGNYLIDNIESLEEIKSELKEELKELEQVNDLKINEFFKDYEMFE